MVNKVWLSYLVFLTFSFIEFKLVEELNEKCCQSPIYKAFNVTFDEKQTFPLKHGFLNAWKNPKFSNKTKTFIVWGVRLQIFLYCLIRKL